jgi:23S rRNA (cytidine2498-2'-O)-methyltransferase
LLELVERWTCAGTTGRIICTIKLQGETDHNAIARFAAIPGATVMHLFHNKHELTFCWCGKAS